MKIDSPGFYTEGAMKVQKNGIVKLYAQNEEQELAIHYMMIALEAEGAEFEYEKSKLVVDKNDTCVYNVFNYMSNTAIAAGMTMPPAIDALVQQVAEVITTEE
jgi:hypothetical protein